MKGILRNLIFGNILIALYIEIQLILRSNKSLFIRVFEAFIKGILRNPIFGNILIALDIEI